MIYRVAKAFLNYISLLLALPLAARSAFGVVHPRAQVCALAPSLPGDYLRFCYYRLTLARCDFSARIQSGSSFAPAQAKVGRRRVDIDGRIKLHAVS